MSIHLTNIDNQIAESVVLRFREFAVGNRATEVGGDAQSGNGSSAVFTTQKVEFQFPPKILSDNRKGDWTESEMMGLEPIANFAKSGSRDMTLSWTYIVENLAENRDGWTMTRIRQNINLVRGYFYRFRNSAGTRDALIVEFGYPMLAGIGLKTCRIKSINVKHSENLVATESVRFGGAFGQTQSIPGLGNPGRVSIISGGIYPKRTDVTLDLRLWTNPSLEDRSQYSGGSDQESAEPKIGPGTLSGTPSPGELWY
jgi:hypothetical protein